MSSMESDPFEDKSLDDDEEIIAEKENVCTSKIPSAKVYLKQSLASYVFSLVCSYYICLLVTFKRIISPKYHVLYITVGFHLDSLPHNLLEKVEM